MLLSHKNHQQLLNMTQSSNTELSKLKRPLLITLTCSIVVGTALFVFTSLCTEPGEMSRLLMIAGACVAMEAAIFCSWYLRMMHRGGIRFPHHMSGFERFIRIFGVLLSAYAIGTYFMTDPTIDIFTILLSALLLVAGLLFILTPRSLFE